MIPPEDNTTIVDALQRMMEHDVESGWYEAQPRSRSLFYGQVALNRRRVPLEVGDGGQFRYDSEAVYWAIGVVRSAMLAAGIDVLDADTIALLEWAEPPIFVVGRRGKRRLLSYDADEPHEESIVWWVDEPPAHGLEFGPLWAEEEPKGFELELVPGLYVPRAGSRGTLRVPGRRRPVEGRPRRGPIGSDGQPMFPSGLSYGLAGNAVWTDDAEAKDELVDFLIRRVDPRLSPEEFATMIVGMVPPDPPHMREGWETIRLLAGGFHQEWQLGADVDDFKIATVPSPDVRARMERETAGGGPPLPAPMAGDVRRPEPVPEVDGRLGIDDVIAAILIPRYEGPKVWDYWQQRLELLLGELGGKAEDAHAEYERHLFLSCLERLPHAVLPWEGASEVPRGFAGALRRFDHGGRVRVKAIKQQMRRAQEEFLSGYLREVYPGIEERWTTEERLVALGLPKDEPMWDIEDF